MSGCWLFQRLGGPPADISDAITALAPFYAIGMVRDTRRYR